MVISLIGLLAYLLQIDFYQVLVIVVLKNFYPSLKKILSLVKLFGRDIECHCIFVLSDVDIVLQYVKFGQDCLRHFIGFELSHNLVFSLGSEGEVAESVDDLDYFVGGVLDFLSGVVFSESEPDCVVPDLFVVAD